jgi:hypothetical protein
MSIIKAYDTLEHLFVILHRKNELSVRALLNLDENC